MFKVVLQQITKHFRNAGALIALLVFLSIALQHSYLLFHVFVELFSVVIAFSLFTISWNARRNMDNAYLLFIGITALFIGLLDTFHVITYQGMNIIQTEKFYANQFWVATRFLEAGVLLAGFWFLRKGVYRLRADLVLVFMAAISILIILSIMYWEIFPTCFVAGQGQTRFKIIAEYVIIAILAMALFMLYKSKNKFDTQVYKLLFASIIFAIITEFMFTLYISNFGLANQIGHYAKLFTFYFIYKANVETGFVKPSEIIYKNLKTSEEKYRTLSEEYKSQGENLLKVNEQNLMINNQLNESLEEVSTLNQQLEQQNDALNEANATKDRFLSILAHDLKSPFSLFIGMTDLLVKNIDKYDKPKIANFAQSIHKSAQRTFELLESLLDWSRLQNGKLKPNPFSFLVSDVLNDVVSLLRRVAENKQIGIEVIEDCKSAVWADADMFKTILRNLISNAIKFSYPESTITVQVSCENTHVVFTITDQGIGMPPEIVEKLFRIEHKVSGRGTANETGTGLGLILCKDFVEANGGRIWVESQKDKGSRFYFTIPKQKPEN